MEVQPLQKLHDYWHLKTPIISCLSQDRLKQIQYAFTIQDPYTSLPQSETP